MLPVARSAHHGCPGYAVPVKPVPLLCAVCVGIAPPVLAGGSPGSSVCAGRNRPARAAPIAAVMSQTHARDGFGRVTAVDNGFPGAATSAELVEYDAFDRPTRVTMGALASGREYDPLDGALVRTTVTATATDELLAEVQYSYDANLNIEPGRRSRVLVPEKMSPPIRESLSISAM